MTKDKIALIFPGQGAQYSGMAGQLIGRYPPAQRIFDEASAVLGFDLIRLCDEGAPAELTRTENAQPALLAHSYASYLAYLDGSYGEPDYAAGQSLGEFSALVCAGALDFASAVGLVRQRGLLMSRAVPEGSGAMCAVKGADPQTAAEICRRLTEAGEGVWISNHNSRGQLVIAGKTPGVKRAAAELEGSGAAVIPLKVSGPFHTPLMESAAESFAAVLAKTSLSDFRFPVISNVTARPYEGAAQASALLVRQLTQPVRWLETMEFLISREVRCLVESGPGATLKRLAQADFKDLEAFSLDASEDREKVFAKPRSPGLKGSRDFVSVINRALAIAVCVRNDNHDDGEYESGVVVPYRRIKALGDEIEGGRTAPTAEHAREAARMLQSVLTTKKCPPDERRSRMRQLFEETGTMDLFADEFQDAVR